MLSTLLLLLIVHFVDVKETYRSNYHKIMHYVWRRKRSMRWCKFYDKNSVIKYVAQKIIDSYTIFGF